jgi:hypothetical protein
LALCGLASALAACGSEGDGPGTGSATAAGAGGGMAASNGSGGAGAVEVSSGATGGSIEPQADAGTPAPCGCFAGNGTYCASRVEAHAAEQGCVAPTAVAHAGDVLSCHGGTWRWDTTCQSSCEGGVASDDACDEPAYQLPWKCDKQHYCTADNADSGHHQAGSFSEFAYDFSLASDTKLRAIRGGVVKIIDMDTGPGDPCYQGCGAVSSYCQDKCADKANKITIRHADGSVALYAHLNAAAPGLHEGQRVEQGEFFAYSGNTGWSTGPHLHFMVMEAGCQGTYCQSIPIEFAGIAQLKKGQSYTSLNCP